jgi:hypothetical protein
MYYSRSEFETQPANYALFDYSLTSDAVFEGAAASFQAGLSPSAKLYSPQSRLSMTYTCFLTRKRKNSRKGNGSRF